EQILPEALPNEPCALLVHAATREERLAVLEHHHVPIRRPPSHRSGGRTSGRGQRCCRRRTSSAGLGRRGGGGHVSARKTGGRRSQVHHIFGAVLGTLLFNLFLHHSTPDPAPALVTWMSIAHGPRSFLPIAYLTASPTRRSLKSALITSAWKKKRFGPPEAGVMKPNPLFKL